MRALSRCYLLPMSLIQILLVDWDDARRHEIAAALRAAGHVTIGERDPRVAAEALVARPEAPAAAFELLVLDLTLPGLDLPALRQAIASDAVAPPDSLEAAERRHIVHVLAHTEGNRRQAALLLGISRSTLLNKIRKYGITAV